MLTKIDESSIAKRRLILRDSLSILSLVLVTVVLFVITLFLFRSFSAHRAELAQRWSERGRRALQQDKPDQAIIALRTALSYAPGTRAYELLLAQALGEAGRTEESYNYFMGLWETQPGDGNINLNLARLAARKEDRTSAVNFYRAAIYGTWEGDGVPRRAQVRLELARYLIAQHDLDAARMELLIAGGNTPDDYDRDMTLGALLQQAEDPADAWTYYQKAISARPHDPAALEAAGRLAYETGDFENAHRLLERAQTEHAATHSAPNSDDVAMLNNAARILQLMPAPSMSARERVGRILAARAIAKKRFDTCSAHFAPATPLPRPLQALSARWSGADGTSTAPALLRDPDLRASALQLVYGTEIQTEKLCSAPAGDDALLLRLATSSHGTASPQAEISTKTNGANK
jgi:Tfp pilus assembly protein PilF